jgi:non-specific protein-tyrosine kinase
MSDKNSKLITLEDPRSPVAEAYRTLRTNIEFSSFEQSLQTLLITSPSPNEGKSTTLANLAIVMAQAEKKTLLVDADLRRPSLHTIFNVGNDRGLTSMFVEPDAMQRPPLQETGVPNLMLLPSGPLPPNPAELMISRRMQDILNALKQQADIVLFDAPPVIAVTDAVVLGARVDGVLLVIEAGHTKREHARRAKELLDKVKVRVIGAVLSNVSQDSAMGGYYSS